MKRYEVDSELERRNRRMKSPIERRLPPVRRESPMMSSRPMPRTIDPYEDYPPPRPKDREQHNAYKILCVGKFYEFNFD